MGEVGVIVLQLTFVVVGLAEAERVGLQSLGRLGVVRGLC